MTQRYCPHCGTRYDKEEKVCALDGTSLFAVASPEDRAGEVLAGKFRLEKRLGSGGFGSVYEATNLTLGRRDGIKLMKPELSRNEEMVKRFLHEAQMATRLKHPHTVTTYDLYQDESGMLILAMELLEGENLAQRLRRVKRLEWRKAAAIASEVCESLEEAHASGMVHRDLKPANIMLCKLFGREDFVKVLDFGIAKAFEGRGDEPSLTGTGQFVGTPAYMSPEHIAGRHLDPRTDIYSLGVVLYEMVSGRLPYAAQDTAAMVHAKLAGPVFPLADACSGLDVPPAVIQLVMAMLGLLPEHRPASVAVVRGALEALLRPGVVQAAGDSMSGDKCESGNGETLEAATAPWPPAPERAIPEQQAPVVAAGTGRETTVEEAPVLRTRLDPAAPRTDVTAWSAGVERGRRRLAVPIAAAAGLVLVAAVLLVLQSWRLGGSAPSADREGDAAIEAATQAESVGSRQGSPAESAGPAVAGGIASAPGGNLDEVSLPTVQAIQGGTGLEKSEGTGGQKAASTAGGNAEGAAEGKGVGEGEADGKVAGNTEGSSEGAAEGKGVGEGEADGKVAGNTEGSTEGAAAGKPAEQAAGTDQKQPADQAAGTDQKQPAEQAAGTDQKQPAEQAAGTDQKKPAEKAAGTVEKKPAEQAIGSEEKKPAEKAAGAAAGKGAGTAVGNAAPAKDEPKPAEAEKDQKGDEPKAASGDRIGDEEAKSLKGSLDRKLGSGDEVEPKSTHDRLGNKLDELGD